MFLVLNATLIIPSSEGELIVHVEKLCEDDTKFLDTRELVPPKDLESIVHLNTIHQQTHVLCLVYFI